MKRGPGSSLALEISSLLVPEPSGVGVFGASLIEKLLERLGGDGLEFVYRAGRHGRRHLFSPAGTRMRPYVTGHFLHRRFDLLHALDTRFPPGYRGRLIATVFDVLSALPIARERQLSPRRFQERKNRQYRQIARRASAIITISEESRDRFVEYFSPSAPMHVIPPGVNPVFRSREVEREGPDPRLEKLGLDDRPFVLFVGELCSRKNLEGVVRAFQSARRAQPELRLVLVGKPSWGWKDSAASCSIRDDPENIRLLGFLPLADLAAVYAGARALLYLSHYEGFGLPLLEAMASGVPVIASRRGGIPEAAGNAVILVDPDCPEEVDAALVALQADEGRWHELRERGLERARQFSWDLTAARVEAVYRQLQDR